MNDRYCNTQGMEAPPVNLETTVFEGIFYYVLYNQKLKNLPSKHNFDGSNPFLFRRSFRFLRYTSKNFQGHDYRSWRAR